MLHGPIWLALLALSGGAQEELPVATLLLDHAALTRGMGQIARDHDGTAAVVPVGVSRAGRSIEALRLRRGADFPGRPAILLVANVDGPLAWTSSVAVDLARALLERAADDAAARALLETTTLYVLPRANPDAAEARFAAPRAEVEATGLGVDNDRDGRLGEDGPADVDGDGVIAWMRVPDPDGEWIEDPADPRATIKADRVQGQRGRWKLVREARDADGDGEAGEDPPHDAVVNRNFPQGWQEHAAASGRYATEEPEARALADFVLLHTDVALVLTLGELDNLTEKPKAKDDAGRRSANPADGIPSADADLYGEIGRRWKKIGAGGRNQGQGAGSFQAWVQAQRGLWTVNLNGWSIPLDEKAPAKEAAGGAAEKKDDGDAPKPSDDAKRLRWIDAHGASERFLPWKPFRHPELGDVEIGGFAPYALSEPPPEQRAKLTRDVTEFVLALAGLLPRLSIEGARAEDLGSGTWRVEAAVVNAGLLPLQSALARRARAIRPARVDLVLPADAQLLGGNRVELISDLAGSGGRHELEWLVRTASPRDIEVRVGSDSAGSAGAAPEVVR